MTWGVRWIAFTCRTFISPNRCSPLVHELEGTQSVHLCKLNFLTRQSPSSTSMPSEKGLSASLTQSLNPRRGHSACSLGKPGRDLPKTHRNSDHAARQIRLRWRDGEPSSSELWVIMGVHITTSRFNGESVGATTRVSQANDSQRHSSHSLSSSWYRQNA